MPGGVSECSVAPITRRQRAVGSRAAPRGSPCCSRGPFFASSKCRRACRAVWHIGFASALGSDLTTVGEDVTETLEVVPRRWKVIQTVREKFTCRDCERISQPPAQLDAVTRGWMSHGRSEQYGQYPWLVNNRTMRRCPMKLILLTCVISVYIAAANQALADPAVPPGLDKAKNLVAGVEKMSGESRDVMFCETRGGERVWQSIWRTLMDTDESHSLTQDLETIFFPDDDSHYGALESKEGGNLTVGGYGQAVNTLVVHDAVANISGDEHPEAVLKLHTYQHLAEACIFVLGTASDCVRDSCLTLAICTPYEDYQHALFECVEEHLPGINERHSWELQLINR